MRSSRFATRSERRHVVLVPGLQDLLREAEQVPRPIRRFLERSESLALDPASCHSQLLFGRELAPAALSRHFDRPHDAAGRWMRADPVGLTPDLAAVWVLAQATLGRDSPVARELSARFAEEGMTLDLCGAQRGYLALPSVPECRFTPPWELAGESMDRVWPMGPGALYWRKLLNETQMILHQHRSASPWLPASLWFWGAGELPAECPVARVRRVHATSPELLGAAAWAGLAVEEAAPEGDALSGSLVEWQPNHSERAEDNLERLATDLGTAMRRLCLGRALQTLELAGEHRVWRLSTLRAWRLW
jgi:hypothetical protein